MDCPSFNCPGFESDTGGIYDPQTDIWTTTSTTGAPRGRCGHTAVWTGRRMLIWGGYHTYAIFQAGPDPIVWFEHNDWGSYDPLTNTWEPLPSGGLLGRTDHYAIWDGSRMLVWGGRHQNYVPFPFQITYEVHNDGAVYDEETRSWSLIEGPAPALPCCGNAAIWTGTAMLLWGGGGATSDGALYDPVTASWIRTTQVQVPEPRANFTAVWDGSGMIVWGGRVGLDYLDTGGRFLPVTRPENADQDLDGFTPCQGDCDHASAIVHPEASEVCDGLDDDCDGSVPLEEQDADADGLSPCGGDCEDTNPAVHPGAPDLPGDKIDEDCDGVAACDPEDTWPNHGSFMRCVVDACNDLVRAGAVSRQTCMNLIRSTPAPHNRLPAAAPPPGGPHS